MLLRASTAAGAAVLRGVHDIEITPGDAGRLPTVRFRLHGRLHEREARLVVGADGRASPVRQQLGLRLEGAQRNAYLTALQVEGVDGWPDGLSAMGADGDTFLLVHPLSAGRMRLYAAHEQPAYGRYNGPGGADRFLATFRRDWLPERRRGAGVRHSQRRVPDRRRERQLGRAALRRGRGADRRRGRLERSPSRPGRRRRPAGRVRARRHPLPARRLVGPRPRRAPGLRRGARGAHAPPAGGVHGLLARPRLRRGERAPPPPRAGDAHGVGRRGSTSASPARPASSGRGSCPPRASRRRRWPRSSRSLQP